MLLPCTLLWTQHWPAQWPSSCPDGLTTKGCKAIYMQVDAAAHSQYMHGAGLSTPAPCVCAHLQQALEVLRRLCNLRLVRHRRLHGLRHRHDPRSNARKLLPSCCALLFWHRAVSHRGIHVIFAEVKETWCDFIPVAGNKGLRVEFVCALEFLEEGAVRLDIIMRRLQPHAWG